MDKRTKRKLNKIRQWVIQILAGICTLNLFFFTPAIKFNQGVFPKIMTAISCAYLVIFIIANIDND